MKRLKDFILGAVFGIVLGVAAISIARFFGIHLFAPGSIAQQAYDKTRVVEKCINEYYQGEVKDEDLANGAAKGMVSALGDKYSQYYTPDEYKQLMSGINGSYVGIGVTLVQKMDNSIEVVKVNDGQPAQKAGIVEGDVITSINGKKLTGMKLGDVVKLVQEDNNQGKTIAFGITRKNADKSKSQLMINVVCEKVQVVSVTSKKFGDVGYIKVSEFDKETDEQFGAMMENMKADDVKGVVIDVRDNGGGSLDSAINMLDELLPEGELITEISKKKGSTVYHSTNEKSYKKPIIVLINGNSASASEVFAGTLQARKVAKLVGEKSFGKGIVQTVLSLEHSCGGGLKLTTSEYFLPGGISIHKIGLTPDLKLEYTGDSKKYDEEKDNQLQSAIKMIE